MGEYLSMNRLFFSYKKYVSMFIVYSITFGLMVLNTGLFWDDWTIYNVDNHGLEQQFGENGYLTFLWLLKGINAINGNEAIILRVVTFLSYFLSALLLSSILGSIKEIDRYSRFILIVMFMVFPVNFARISIANANHALNYFLFFLGFFLLMKYLSNRKIFYRLTALFLFFFSFFTPSHLVFFLTAIIYMLYIENVNPYRIRQIVVFIKKYLDFILLPIIYWIIKKLFIKTSGHYENYNEVSLENIIKTPERIISSFQSSFIEPIFGTFPKTITWLIILLLLWSLLIIGLRKCKVTLEDVKMERDFGFIMLGFVFFVLGVFAYLAVGKSLSINDWNSRQQLLVPLGASFITYYSIKVIAHVCKINKDIITLFYSLIVASFISSHISVYYDYQKDWIKQLSIIENFKESSIIKENTTFVFKDNATNLNTLDRNYRFYEYTGLFKLIYNEETKLGVGETKSKINLQYYNNSKKYRFFNISDYEVSDPQYKIILDYGKYKLGIVEMTKLVFNKHFDNEQYKNDLKNVIDIQYIKI